MAANGKWSEVKRRDGAADAPCGHGDLGQAPQRGGLSQTHKRDERLFQEIHLADQDVGGFGVARNLLHEFVLQLWERRRGGEHEHRHSAKKFSFFSPNSKQSPSQVTSRRSDGGCLD